VVAVLFVSKGSNYRRLSVECFDEVRDARTFSGGSPVVCHPPCRAWGRYAHLALPSEHERDLARFAVRQVRTCGGVLEHPAYSRLWMDARLPNPGRGKDVHGGWTFSVDQSWWGHRAPKPTWLYVVGCEPSELPEVPFHLGTAEGRIEMMGRAERERTPLAFCEWLVSVAERCANVGLRVSSQSMHPACAVSGSAFG